MKVTLDLAFFAEDTKAQIEIALSYPFAEIPTEERGFQEGTVFVGEPACHDEAWLEASTKYAEQATITVSILKTLPARKGTEILVPIIQARRSAEEKGPTFQRPKDSLQGMIDIANDHGGHPEKLARRALIMGLASTHLTTLAAAHVVYDLCARPEQIEPLQEELIQALKQVSFHRIVQREPITLTNGKVIPAGAQICTTSYAVLRDPNIIPQQEFNGFRYNKMRQQTDESQRHQCSSIDKNHLHFRAGSNACPGCWLVGNQLEMMVGELLLNYDIEYLDGQGRPANTNVDEFNSKDPDSQVTTTTTTTMMMKRRL
ncbi:hypothetical protein N7G274_002482 [Stereocaulon virgatum]|uniref:Cytochrome P450 n=1 Tax=Stereocaulon virgatum TaxID=373712 RepID=A0ABR4AMN6_9LECA